MLTLLLTLTCLTLETDPLVVVENLEEAVLLSPDVTHVRIEMRNHEMLAAVLKQAPNIRSLELHHPGNKIPLKSLRLLSEFPKLETLRFTGDPFLSDEKFAVLGKLNRLKTLSMSLS